MRGFSKKSVGLLICCVVALVVGFCVSFRMSAGDQQRLTVGAIDTVRPAVELMGGRKAADYAELWATQDNARKFARKHGRQPG